MEQSSWKGLVTVQRVWTNCERRSPAWGDHSSSFWWGRLQETEQSWGEIFLENKTIYCIAVCDYRPSFQVEEVTLHFCQLENLSQPCIIQEACCQLMDQPGPASENSFRNPSALLCLPDNLCQLWMRWCKTPSTSLTQTLKHLTAVTSCLNFSRYSWRWQELLH